MRDGLRMKKSYHMKAKDGWLSPVAGEDSKGKGESMYHPQQSGKSG